MAGEPFGESELAVVRRAFARQMMALANVQDDRIQRAFATVRREDFLGSEPWQIVWRPPRPPMPRNDPACIYQDVVIALQPGRGVNNGSPALHVKMLHDLAVEPGQHVAHIGAGAGYYTAMLAELTGPAGRVTAFEYDETLAERARINLAAWRNVTVIAADGAGAPTEPVDRIYVNFAVAAPSASWIDGLAPGGRLLFSLGAPHPDVRAKFPRHSAQGGVFIVDRTANGLAALWLYPAYYVCAEGGLAADAEAELALYNAFQRGGFEFIKSLRWEESFDPLRCWYWTAQWGLSYDGLGGPAA
jgi:protein-L-isoaspartate(D-aspartate) O-methyltransferase